jgi:hypothetical protein
LPTMSNSVDELLLDRDAAEETTMMGENACACKAKQQATITTRMLEYMVLLLAVVDGKVGRDERYMVSRAILKLASGRRTDVKDTKIEYRLKIIMAK